MTPEFRALEQLQRLAAEADGRGDRAAAGLFRRAPNLIDAEALTELGTAELVRVEVGGSGIVIRAWNGDDVTEVLLYLPDWE